MNVKKIFLALVLCLLIHPVFSQVLLREDTASQVVSIGPFLDPADGTADGGLTIDAADVRLKVNGGADVAKNNGGCTHDVNGMYDCTFDATDTATVGRLNVSICETGAVCISRTFVVVEEAVFDACCVASAAPLTAALLAALDVSDNDDVADSWGERISRIPNAAAGATSGLPVLDANGNVQADLEAISDDTTAASNAELVFDNTGFSMNNSVINNAYIEEFACDAGSDADTCIDTGLGEADNFWRGTALRSMAGTTIGMERCIVASSQGSTSVTVAPPFPASLGTGVVRTVNNPLCSGVDPTYVP